MLKSFKIGGVHPPENKYTAGCAIQVLPTPDKVIIPLSQHIGAPATAIVQKGDKVKAGQVIATAGGFVSANVHSSVSGTVLDVAPVKDAAGLLKPAITIQVEGEEWADEVVKTAKNIDEFEKEEIIKAISDAGIVGMGGATFPTHVKLSPPPGSKAEYLIINGVECEPYLTADHRLMLEKTNEIIAGIKLVMKAIGVNKAIIGIENNKPDAIAKMQAATTTTMGIDVCPLKVRYPQGGEKQLIKATIGRSVPSGALPIAVGAVVQNIGTIYAVYEAVMLRKPLVERVVTVTGESLKNPGNFLCKVGTPISKLIEAAGGLPEDTGKVIGGGPMMGRTMINIDSPVMKGTSGVLILPESKSARGEMHPCIKCAKCVSACPMGLEPYLLATITEMTGDLERLEKEKIMDCIECGCCMYTCPANRPLLDYIRLGKGRTGAMIRNRSQKK